MEKSKIQSSGLLVIYIKAIRIFGGIMKKLKDWVVEESKNFRKAWIN